MSTGIECSPGAGHHRRTAWRFGSERRQAGRRSCGCAIFIRSSRILTSRPLTEPIAIRRSDVAAVMTACFGAWLFWSQFTNLSTLSWFYDRAPDVHNLRGRGLPAPDYDLGSLPWKQASPRLFDLQPGRMTLVTNADPFGYQIFASVDTN